MALLLDLLIIHMNQSKLYLEMSGIQLLDGLSTWKYSSFSLQQVREMPAPEQEAKSGAALETSIDPAMMEVVVI